MLVSNPVSKMVRQVRQHFQSHGDLPVGQEIKLSGGDLRDEFHAAVFRDEGPNDLSPGQGVVHEVEPESETKNPNQFTIHYQGTTEDGWLRSTQFMSKNGKPFDHGTVERINHADIIYQGNTATSLFIMEHPEGFKGFLRREQYLQDGTVGHQQARSFTNEDYENFLTSQ